MRRILYIAIAVLGLAGVTTAAVVSGSGSAPEKRSSCSALKGARMEGTKAVSASAAEKSEDDDDSGCFFRSFCSE